VGSVRPMRRWESLMIEAGVVSLLMPRGQTYLIYVGFENIDIRFSSDAEPDASKVSRPIWIYFTALHFPVIIGPWVLAPSII
jgi:hypothetical protein